VSSPLPSGVVLIAVRLEKTLHHRAEAFTQVIGHGCTVTVAVLFQSATTGVVFAAYAAVFTLILQSKVQAINQTEEVWLR
jgi:hypothetical protein